MSTPLMAECPLLNLLEKSTGTWYAARSSEIAQVSPFGGFMPGIVLWRLYRALY